VAQHRPNIFSNSIAHIGPDETIEVTIEYQQKLHFEQLQYSLRFPMTIKPDTFQSAQKKNHKFKHN
jgi:Ca-activated chloride channel family protein